MITKADLERLSAEYCTGPGREDRTNGDWVDEKGLSNDAVEGIMEAGVNSILDYIEQDGLDEKAAVTIAFMDMFMLGWEAGVQFGERRDELPS